MDGCSISFREERNRCFGGFIIEADDLGTGTDADANADADADADEVCVG